MIDGTFSLRFEYISAAGDIVRSEHIYGGMHASLTGSAADIGKRANELRAKVINSLKEDGIIPPPTNVLRVDFQKRKLVAA